MIILEFTCLMSWFYWSIPSLDWVHDMLDNILINNLVLCFLFMSKFCISLEAILLFVTVP
jgi:hypothetical protein